MAELARHGHLSLLLPLLGLLACSPDPVPRHLVAIVVDTLRADALGLYGNPRGTSPNLDSLARESLVFEHAWAQGTYTLSSYLSYMSSTNVRSHGYDFPVRQIGSTNVRSQDHDVPVRRRSRAGVCGWGDIEMLSEVLARNGFRTQAFVANPVLTPWKGFARGFQDWNGVRLDPADQSEMGLWLRFWLKDGLVVEAAEAALESWGEDRREFLYLHLMDPHAPLTPSPAGLEAVGAPADWSLGGEPGGDPVEWQRKQWTPEEKERVRDGYLASVWDADQSVGRILRAVGESGHADDTVVVFFADHGEQIWEHGEQGHERGVWEELAHVPLLIRIPGWPAERIDRSVGLLDLAPTLLKVLGIEELPASWQGRSLFEPGVRIVVSERLEETAATRDGTIKGILGPWRDGKIWSYFDLDEDPGEQEPRSKATGVGKLKRDYQRWSASTPRVDRNPWEPRVGICAVTPKERERFLEDAALRALGYIQ